MRSKSRGEGGEEKRRRGEEERNRRFGERGDTFWLGSSESTLSSRIVSQSLPRMSGRGRGKGWQIFLVGRGDMQDFCGLLAKDARCLAEQSRGACRAKVQRCNSGNSYSSRLRPYRWSGWALWMGPVRWPVASAAVRCGTAMGLAEGARVRGPPATCTVLYLVYMCSILRLPGVLR